LFEVELLQIPGIVFTGDENSCFAVYYSTTGEGREVTVSCYAGLCTYRLPGTESDPGTNTPTPLPSVIAVGSQVKINLDRVVALDPQLPIPVTEAQVYQSISQRRENLSIGTCISDLLPTPTPTGSATAIILPTDTPTATPTATRRPTTDPYP
jgi:hypothetical protein